MIVVWDSWFDVMIVIDETKTIVLTIGRIFYRALLSLQRFFLVHKQSVFFENDSIVKVWLSNCQLILFGYYDYLILFCLPLNVRTGKSSSCIDWLSFLSNLVIFALRQSRMVREVASVLLLESNPPQSPVDWSEFSDGIRPLLSLTWTIAAAGGWRPLIVYIKVK